MKIKMKKFISLVLVLLILLSNSPISLAMDKESFGEHTKESNSIVITNTQEIKEDSPDEKRKSESKSNSLEIKNSEDLTKGPIINSFETSKELPKTYFYENGEIEISIELKQGTLQEEAQLIVKEVDSEKDDRQLGLQKRITNMITEKLNEKQKLNKAKIYDIYFINKDGDRIHDLEILNIHYVFKKPFSLEEQNELSIFSLFNNELIDCKDTEIKRNDRNEIVELSFEVDKIEQLILIDTVEKSVNLIEDSQKTNKKEQENTKIENKETLDEFIQLEKSLSGNKKITIEGLRKDFSALEGEIQLEVKELNPNYAKDKKQIEINETEMEKFIPEKSDSIKINWHHYDVRILLDGEKIEPVNKLRASFSGFDTTDLDDAKKEVKVLHLNQLTNEVEDKEIEIGENGVVEAEFDSFSPITVVEVKQDHPSTLKETDFVNDVNHYMEYAPASLGKAEIYSSQILNPGRTSNAFGNIVLEHGQVVTKKTATPVKGKVNTWDITVRAEGRDNIPDTTDVVLVLDNSYSMYEEKNKLADGRTRFQAAQEAAKKFVDIALNENPNLRIAIVVYNGEVTINSGDIKQPFSQDKQALYSNIDAIKEPPSRDPEKKAGTFTQAGIKQAGEILKGSSADNKHMVLMADGFPTFSYDLDSSSWDEKIEQTELYYKSGGPLNTKDVYKRTKYYRLPKDESKIKFNYNNRVGLGSENMSSVAYKTLKVNKNIKDVHRYTYGEYKTGTKDPNNIDLTVQAHRYHVDGEDFAREYRYAHQESTVLEAKRLREDLDIGLDTLYSVGVGFETYTGQKLEMAVRTLSRIADSGKFHDVRNAERLTDTFKELAKTVSIKSAMRDFKIVDTMGKGFTVTDESKIKVSEGKTSFDRNSETINWDIGTVTKSVAAKSDVRYAELTYRIEINDDILTLPGAKTNQHENFITNAVTDLTYTDNLKDEKKTVSIDSPKVDPVLLKVKKVLLDSNGKLLNEDITFTINVTNDLKTYDESNVLSSNEDYKWRTTLRDEGTYSVDEIATPEKNYITTIKIDGEETSKFLVNHEGDIPRGDVNIEVTNQELGGYELPTTGGSGSTIFRLTGLLVLAIALIIPYRKRQIKCER